MNERDGTMETANTVPKLLKRNYGKYGDQKVAMRVKDRGIWREYTWKDCYEKVRFFSLGLISMGLKWGDKVSVIGENKPEWYWADIATQASGGAVVGIYPDCMPHEVKYFVEHSASKFVVAQDQEQVDKLLQIRNELPLVTKVIYWDSKGLWNYDDPILMSFDEVITLGEEYGKLHPGLFESNVERTGSDDVCLICYTSGTSGLPKGVMYTQRSVIYSTGLMLAVDKWREDDQYLSMISPAWGTEHLLGVNGMLMARMEVNFPEDPETAQENIREVGAGLIFFGPRQWESIIRTFQARITDTSASKRFIYNLLLPVGYKVADLRVARRRISWFWRFLYTIAYWGVYRPLRDKAGLSKTRYAYSAGAPMSPEIVRYFLAIGVNIKQFYGTSEVGVITLRQGDDIRWETSGPPLPTAEIRLTDEGNTLVRTPGAFIGYYNDPEATQERLRDGWFYSGDFGYVDQNDGHVIIIDRLEDTEELSDGRRFSPQYVESRLRFSAYIKDALVVGSKDKAYAVGIMNIDLDNIGRWAEVRSIPYTTFADLSQKEAVIELVREQIKRVNKTVPDWARVRKFVNLHREFDPDEAELTRTRKMRRSFVEARYRYLIDALYGDEEETVVETPITYRDGRKGVTKTSIKINWL